MYEADTRALRRAVILLVIASLARWSWSTARQPSAAEGTVLPELLSATRDASAEAAQRTAPLAEGERIDPNRASEIQLDRLPGIGPVTARAIVSARESGHVFRELEDLLAVRGVGPVLLSRIGSVVDLTSPPSARRRGGGGDPVDLGGRIDVNRADLDRLQELRGVGPAIAARIVAERRKQMFSSVDDLLRVDGVGPAMLERLRGRVTVGRAP